MANNFKQTDNVKLTDQFADIKEYAPKYCDSYIQYLDTLSKDTSELNTDNSETAKQAINYLKVKGLYHESLDTRS